MIIKEIEKRGITKILNYLNKYDLNDLVLTVTNRLIPNFKEEESISLILNYSQDALSFLKKKKIKKELIFRFLNEEQIFVKSTLTKPELIRECLKYWGATVNECESMDCSDDDEVTIIETNSTVSLHSNHQNANQLSTCNNFLTANNQPSNESFNNQLSPTGNQPSLDQQQIIQLSLEFGKWFFSILPEINNNAFDVNNFWPDSQLKVQFEYNSRSFCLSESGNLQNLNLLKQLVLNNLKFKPNLLPQFDGVRAKLEEHGLLVTVISGILYLGDEPIGWFESYFGLIPDSNLNEHNWRIKFLEIKMKFSKPVPSIDYFIDSYNKRIKDV